jgi:SAM-dependent methyltransferase
MEIIDLGDPGGRPEGFATLPEVGGPRAQVATLDRGTPLADSSVGLIRAHDVLPRLRDKIAVFNELYRILCHGGILLTFTPSTDGRGAFQDPLQVAFYNENSFWYFIDGEARAFVPEIRCRFVASQLSTFYPTEWHEAHRISYVKATLVAIKEGSRQGGQLDS